MVRKLGRSGAHAATKKRPKKSPAVVAGVSARTRGNDPKRNSALDSGPSLAARIQAEREQLFKAISLVECCKYASATLLDVESPEYLGGVYDLLCDLLDSSAGELGCIVESCAAQATNHDPAAR